MRDHERGNGKHRPRGNRFADRSRRSGDILLENSAVLKEAKYRHADDRGRVGGGDRLARLQTEVGVSGAKYDAHYEAEQDRPQREFLHLHCRWDKRLVCAHESLAFTFSLSILPSIVFPASFACAAFITRPICFTDVAEVSASAASTAAWISSSVAEAGR